jgi:hypothetical protein
MAQASRDGYESQRELLAVVPGLRDYVCRPDFLGVNAALPADSLDGFKEHRARQTP